MTLDQTQLDEWKSVAEAATPGARSWYGFGRTHSLRLSTLTGGRKCILAFERWGTQRAQPRFRNNDVGLMQAACDLLVMRHPESDEIVGINNPDARFFEKITPDVVLALLAEITVLRERPALTRVHTQAMTTHHLSVEHKDNLAEALAIVRRHARGQ
jgi:hypothetical protein